MTDLKIIADAAGRGDLDLVFTDVKVALAGDLSMPWWEVGELIRILGGKRVSVLEYHEKPQVCVVGDNTTAGTKYLVAQLNGRCGTKLVGERWLAKKVATCQ